ncbi:MULTISPECIES: MarR family winged helix-turn-helix transcriptional regulator [Paeniglutamicibacter]|uniref:DNA-binding MarR family transcriptional regulator n=1 Tax=Paeniglutamicibacter sulfureus TaxID=43666 RepID=A0ABU2BMC9_9MICC|nr:MULTISPECIES: MarR family transcriptional regulator [Paeniglutamicibacter]MCV9994738.1 MarR family transcriptional regulator [Paeniglutamicibacter sp. ZC-3]MDO2935139.1 MarR family transcriptional regulator [Paeniglutamicibacter sulfureus]MDR7359451.1 DNA-binding MarR family transcriptional regulator [Paeniglutamicibacter sulfureus]
MPFSSNSAPPGDLSELFHRAWRSLRQTWSARLAPFELTPHQSRAMRSLAQHGNSSDPASGAGMRLKEIAERLRIAPRSATEVIDQLEAKQLVIRRPDPLDRRATLVSLTEEGMGLSERVRAARRLHTEEYFGRLDAQERAELARILEKLSGTPGR